MGWHQVTKAMHLPFGFLGSVPCTSGERCCSLWGALPGDPRQALPSGSWAASLLGGCLLGARLCLRGSAWVSGRQGRAWGLQDSGLSLPFCCSASLRLFSSSRFLEAKPMRQRKTLTERYPFKRSRAFRGATTAQEGLGNAQFPQRHNFWSFPQSL